MKKLKKNDSNVQKAFNNRNKSVISENHRSTDSNCSENFSNDQNYLEKIGVRNPHPWNLIGLR